MSKRDDLIELLRNDKLGLLRNVFPKSNKTTIDNILVNSFEEINDFVEEFKREPIANLNDIIEYRLYSRLSAIRSDPEKSKVLSTYDYYNLLADAKTKQSEIEDIIVDDPFGLLNDTKQETDIFNLKYVKPAERINPDYISRRKLCKNFHEYESIFETLHIELKLKKRRFTQYHSKDLCAGRFFALDGILLYLKSIDGKIDNYDYSSGNRERFDGKTHCIFDNGTESDMLYRSLDKALQINGYTICSDLETSIPEAILEDEDKHMGYIYVLKSKNPQVQHISELYKIGHTTGSVGERIRNSKKQSTYLFGDVEVVGTYRCYNISSLDVEQSIHELFNTVRMNFEIFDATGNLFQPQEWFVVSLDNIEESIKLLQSGVIHNYYYDDRISTIVKR